MNRIFKRVDTGALLVLVFLVASWAAARYYAIDIDSMHKALARYPLALSVAAYIIAYVAVTFFIFFSKDIFWLVGAMLFGPLLSGLCIYIAECLNACLLWCAARIVGARFAGRWLTGNYAHLDVKIKKVSFAWLFVLRAAPLVPYRFLDIAAGLSGISVKRYFAAVVLGSWLKIFWVQYMLAAMGTLALTDSGAVAEYYLHHPALLWVSLVYVALVLAAAVTLKGKRGYGRKN